MGGQRTKSLAGSQAAVKPAKKVVHKEKVKKTPRAKDKVVLAARKRPVHGKRYRERSEQVERFKEYGVAEALELAKKTSFTGFDGSIELHVRLGIDPNQGDQTVRGTVSLPKGTGKVLRVAVVGDAAKVSEAKKAGAELAGGDELLQKIEKGEFGFDVLVVTPSYMPKLAKLGKLLGPKGLMPNPKTGTVTDQVAKAVSELKAGRVEFKADAGGVVHGVVGKVSFSAADLEENLRAYVRALAKARPDAVKVGAYFRSIALNATMGPGIRVALKDALA